MTAPRIDQVRRSAEGTIALIRLALEHVDDLHAIGWYRHADYRARQRVAGGDPTAVGIDLDNNGNPDARAAYDQLGTALLAIQQTTAEAVHRALKHFDSGLIRARRDITADATSLEVIDALARQEQRHTNGEWTSASTVVQPMPSAASRFTNITRLQAELDALRSAVRKAGIRPDRSRLTPLEITAWQTATGTPAKRKKRR